MGRQEGYGYPEGHHTEGFMGRQGRRPHGGQWNCWNNVTQGKGTMDFNSVLWRRVHMCVHEHLCVLIIPLWFSANDSEYKNKILFL